MPEIADTAAPRLARGVRLQIDSTTGKGVLLFPEGILELNETSQEIIARCDGRSVSDIVRDLAESYDADPGTIGTDVREALLDLKQRRLIEM